MNNDGNLDLLLTGGTINSVGVRLGNGDSSFGSAAYRLAGSGAGKVVLADVNGDGDLDLVVAGASGVFVMINNGNGFLRLPSPPS